MIRKIKPIYVQQTLLEKGMTLFSPSDFKRTFDVSLWATQGFLKNHSHDLFLKIRNGLYVLRSDPPQEFTPRQKASPVCPEHSRGVKARMNEAGSGFAQANSAGKEATAVKQWSFTKGQV